jgi:hypothetical protein
MTIEIINAAAAEPLDINGVKLSRRITSTDQDAELFRCMRTARETCEQITRRQLMVSRLRLTLDSFPGFGVCSAFDNLSLSRGGSIVDPLSLTAIEIPRPPLVAIESITYVDTAGTTQSLNVLTDIIVDSSSEPARIFPAYGTTWPLTRAQAGAVKITFLSGFATVLRPDVSADTLTLLGPARTFVDGDQVRLSNSGGKLPGGLDEWTDYYVKAPSGSSFQVSLTDGGSCRRHHRPGHGHQLCRRRA